MDSITDITLLLNQLKKLLKVKNNLFSIKEISLKLFKNLKNDLIILGNLSNKFILSIFVICSNKSVEKGFFANIIIDKIMKIFNGKGGGSKYFANGGCQFNEDIEKCFINAAYSYSYFCLE